ncbi:hypothetical protein [Ureibacillus xyleni]|nr:hypothetical protein [Ureibacillus xyleni]
MTREWTVLSLYFAKELTIMENMKLMIDESNIEEIKDQLKNC